MRILLGVAKQLGENPSHLRGKGSPVKLIYWGLVVPKQSLKKSFAKGNPVNIQEPAGVAPVADASGYSEYHCRGIQVSKPGECHKGENRVKARMGHLKVTSDESWSP